MKSQDYHTMKPEPKQEEEYNKKNSLCTASILLHEKEGIPSKIEVAKDPSNGRTHFVPNSGGGNKYNSEARAVKSQTPIDFFPIHEIVRIQPPDLLKRTRTNEEAATTHTPDII